MGQAARLEKLIQLDKSSRTLVPLGWHQVLSLVEVLVSIDKINKLIQVVLSFLKFATYSDSSTFVSPRALALFLGIELFRQFIKIYAASIKGFEVDISHTESNQIKGKDHFTIINTIDSNHV